MIAHGLAVIENAFFGGSVDPDRTALLAVFHDAEEVITGDLPTPIKYFNPEVKEAVDGLETVAKQRLLGMLPESLRPTTAALLRARRRRRAWRMVKLADKLCAYLKCLEEAKAGNREFARAEEAIRATSRRLASRSSTTSWRRSCRASGSPSTSSTEARAASRPCRPTWYSARRPRPGPTPHGGRSVPSRGACA
jgi:5'-deoxynucleotidase YfbR-like HD superfamily hydrolase